MYYVHTYIHNKYTYIHNIHTYVRTYIHTYTHIRLDTLSDNWSSYSYVYDASILGHDSDRLVKLPLHMFIHDVCTCNRTPVTNFAEIAGVWICT